MDHIPAELIKARGRKIYSEIRILINSIGIRRDCLSRGMSQSLPIHKEGIKKQTVVIIEAYHFCQLHKKFYPTSCCMLTPNAEEIIGDHQYGF